MTEKTLPTGFHFSQSSLQDYVDCPRRFELRYILRQAWPDVQAQPVLAHELQMWRGTTFHRLAHRHAIGIPADVLSAGIEDEYLRRWWQAYQDSPPDLPQGIRLPEMILHTPLRRHGLLAKYDLIAADEEQVVIVDWKTDQRRPAPQTLARRLQTRVYPFVIVEAGASLLGRDNLDPAELVMIYWFAEFPHQVERFSYDAGKHEENRRYLTGLIAEISRSSVGSFPLTDDERHCRFCVYRSLCERDVSAGDMSDMSEVDSDSGWSEIDLDLEQVAEIVY